MNKGPLLIFFTLMVLGSTWLTGCVDYVDIEQRQDMGLIEKKLEERRAEYLTQKMIQCRLDILDRAEAFVDSIIDFEIKLNVLDPSLFPLKPVKPSYPKYIRLDDSTVVRPLFDRWQYRSRPEAIDKDTVKN